MQPVLTLHAACDKWLLGTVQNPPVCCSSCVHFQKGTPANIFTDACAHLTSLIFTFFFPPFHGNHSNDQKRPLCVQTELGH